MAKDAKGHGSDSRGMSAAEEAQNRSGISWAKHARANYEAQQAAHQAGISQVGLPMTQAQWDSMSGAEREKARDNSALSPQLKGLEGHRVEATTNYGETRRFIVGRSTGWKPIHLEIARRTSSGGSAAERQYASIRSLGKVR